MSDEPASHSLTEPQDALTAVRSWDELEQWVSAEAERAGVSSAEALKDLRRKGPAVRALCALLGVQVPAGKKRGPKEDPTRDFIIEMLEAHARTELGLSGDAKWDWIHREIDNPDKLFGYKLNVNPAALERSFFRSRKIRSD